MNAPVTRPAMRYLGGKWLLAPWVIEHLPPHHVYVEPFGGAGSVLLRKPRADGEVYNDIDGEVVNLFSVLTDRDMTSGEPMPGAAAELVRLVELTPFARTAFEGAYLPTSDPVERARRLLTRSFMGHGNISARIDRTTGFRSNSNRSGTTPAHDWRNYPGALPATIERLRGVVIENGDAVAVMRRHDSADTLHYVDPPYVHETRGRSGGGLAGGGVAPSAGYRHELTGDDHRTLLDALLSLKGMVVLSGYPTDEYDSLLTGWMRVEREALADGARKRLEILWINPPAQRALTGWDALGLHRAPAAMAVTA
jgi:DNA adenine methylase